MSAKHLVCGLLLAVMALAIGYVAFDTGWDIYAGIMLILHDQPVNLNRLLLRGLILLPFSLWLLKLSCVGAVAMLATGLAGTSDETR